MDNILNVINRELGINIFRNTRKREYVDGRALFYFILREHFKYSYTYIGKICGRYGKVKNHATVLHSLRDFEIRLKYNPKFNDIIDNLTEHGTRLIRLNYAKDNLNKLNERELKFLVKHLTQYDTRVKRKHHTRVQRVEEKSKERTLQGVHR
tara:strand:- start:12 stop:467 length:456 start_codon:yes stop_codon:yes gene_type:complete